MGLRQNVSLITCLALAGAGASLGACSGGGDDNSSTVPKGDGGLDATSPMDAGGSTPDAGSGDAGQPDSGDAGGLSAQAQAGLTASPFTINTSAMTTTELEQVGRGSYIVNVVSSCPDCHNNPAAAPGSGFLAGGNQFGPVKSRNLTSDPNHGLRMSQAQFLEVLQTGKDQKLSPDGGAPVSLIVMPWEDYRWMSVTDLEAIYAYLQLVPADSNDVTLPTVSGGPPLPMPTTFTDGAQTTPPALPSETGDAPLFEARGRAVQALVEPSGVQSLSAADQASYGRGAYLVAQAICYECHTNPERLSPMTSTKFNTAQWLTGGRVFAAPPVLAPIVHVDRSMSANLLGATHGFIFSSGVDESIFTKTIQMHVHADDPGTPPLAWPMPQGLKKLVPDDIHALWVYLSHQTPITGAADKATQGAAVYCAATDASATGVCPTGSTCDLTANECVPSATCTSDGDCSACQTCTTSACALPALALDGGANACIATGI